MQTIEKKTAGTFIYGVGNIEVKITQIGKPEWLKEIELFVTGGGESFAVIAMNKPELKNPEHIQRAIQAFINHIQEGQIEQKSNLIRNHFRNWLNSMNGSLKYIINGQQSNNGGNTAKGGTSNDRVEALRNW
jgi:hypothetical protein